MDIVRLTPRDLVSMRKLNALFGQVFGDAQSYVNEPPPDVYLRNVLSKDHIIALAAFETGTVVGGLVAYELEKLEQARRELYIYDLAVSEPFRRRGVASALIRSLQHIAEARDAYVILVQADYEDDAAIALYEKLGTRQEVLHFDIAV